MENWIINKDNEVDCIKEVVSDKKDHITYKNLKGELVAVDKSYFYTYEYLMQQSQAFTIGSKVQKRMANGKYFGKFELFKILPNIDSNKVNRYVLLHDNTFLLADKIRLYDERIIAIETKMNKSVTTKNASDAIANLVRALKDA